MKGKRKNNYVLYMGCAISHDTRTYLHDYLDIPYLHWSDKVWSKFNFLYGMQTGVHLNLNEYKLLTYKAHKELEINYGMYSDFYINVEKLAKGIV